MIQNIHGIGTDIVDIRRIARVLKHYPQRFPQRILHPKEYITYQTHADPISYLARQFAAKEAISKALGHGFRGSYHPRCLLVERDKQGKPTVRLPNNGTNLSVKVSISDEKNYALAYALAWTKA